MDMNYTHGEGGFYHGQKNGADNEKRKRNQMKNEKWVSNVTETTRRGNMVDQG